MNRFIVPLALVLFPLTEALASAIEPKEVHQSLPLDAKGELSVRTFKGEVNVVAWDKAEVKLDARIEPDLSCGDDAQQAELMKNTEIRIQPSGSSIDIATDYHRDQIQWVEGCS